MSEQTTGWQVLTAAVSKATGGLKITGRNYDAANPIDFCFRWDITESVNNPRYDWSLCVFSEGAQERLAQLRARSQR